MGFPDTLFPAIWMWFGNVVFVTVLMAAVRAAPWMRLAAPARLHIALGTCVGLALLWSMRAGVLPGQGVHLIGAGIATLMFGPSLALVALSVVMAATTLNTGAHWQAFGLNALVAVVTPVLVVDGLRRLVERWLPANFFIYIFLCAFFGSGLAALSAGLGSTLLMAMADIYPLDGLLEGYLIYFILLGFSEAWINGIIVTLLVVYAPGWVGSFDDSRYLRGK